MTVNCKEIEIVDSTELLGVTISNIVKDLYMSCMHLI